MTIKEVITDLNLRNLENRMAKLNEIGAPNVVVDSLKTQIETLKSGNIKVNGMARKFKVADEQVTALYQADGFTYDYKKGKLKTVIIKMETSAGEFFYDYTGNKISNKVLGLDAKATEEFELVWN